MNVPLADRGVRAVLLDIEGTTTSIAYVYDELFPYARAHLPSYVASHVGHAQLDEPVRLLTKEKSA